MTTTVWHSRLLVIDANDPSKNKGPWTSGQDFPPGTNLSGDVWAEIDSPGLYVLTLQFRADHAPNWSDHISIRVGSPAKAGEMYVPLGIGTKLKGWYEDVPQVGDGYMTAFLRASGERAGDPSLSSSEVEFGALSVPGGGG